MERPLCAQETAFISYHDTDLNLPFQWRWKRQGRHSIGNWYHFSWKRCYLIRQIFVGRKWQNFRLRNSFTRQNFAQQSSAQQRNHTFSKWLISRLDSLVLQLKTLLHFLGHNFSRVKVTNFRFDDKNFSRQSFALYSTESTKIWLVLAIDQCILHFLSHFYQKRSLLMHLSIWL